MRLGVRGPGRSTGVFSFWKYYGTVYHLNNVGGSTYFGAVASYVGVTRFKFGAFVGQVVEPCARERRGGVTEGFTLNVHCYVGRLSYTKRGVLGLY